MFFVEAAGYQRIYDLDPFIADHLPQRSRLNLVAIKGWTHDRDDLQQHG